MSPRPTLAPPRKATNEWHAIVRALVDDLKRKHKMSRAGVFRAFDRLGVRHTTVRDVYYGRRAADAHLTAVIKAAGAELYDEVAPAYSRFAPLAVVEDLLRAATEDIRRMQKSVDAMCLACAGQADGDAPTCWDGSCPLRAMSPLPLRRPR